MFRAPGRGVVTFLVPALTCSTARFELTQVVAQIATSSNTGPTAGPTVCSTSSRAAHPATSISAEHENDKRLRQNPAQDLLFANRRPPTVWISTVLGKGSPSGLAYPSSDCATGTVVARAGDSQHRVLAPESGRPIARVPQADRSVFVQIAASSRRRRESSNRSRVPCAPASVASDKASIAVMTSRCPIK